MIQSFRSPMLFWVLFLGVFLFFGPPASAAQDYSQEVLEALDEMAVALEAEEWETARGLSESFFKRHGARVYEQPHMSSEAPLWSSLRAASIVGLRANDELERDGAVQEILNGMLDRASRLKVSDSERLSATLEVRQAQIFTMGAGTGSTLFLDKLNAAFDFFQENQNPIFTEAEDIQNAALQLLEALALYASRFGALPTDRPWADFLREEWSSVSFHPSSSKSANGLKASLFADIGDFDKAETHLSKFEQEHQEASADNFLAAGYADSLRAKIEMARNDGVLSPETAAKLEASYMRTLSGFLEEEDSFFSRVVAWVVTKFFEWSDPFAGGSDGSKVVLQTKPKINFAYETGLQEREGKAYQVLSATKIKTSLSLNLSYASDR